MNHKDLEPLFFGDHVADLFERHVCAVDPLTRNTLTIGTRVDVLGPENLCFPHRLGTVLACLPFQGSNLFEQLLQFLYLNVLVGAVRHLGVLRLGDAGVARVYAKHVPS